MVNDEELSQIIALEYAISKLSPRFQIQSFVVKQICKIKQSVLLRDSLRCNELWVVLWTLKKKPL